MKRNNFETTRSVLTASRCGRACVHCHTRSVESMSGRVGHATVTLKLSLPHLLIASTCVRLLASTVCSVLCRGHCGGDLPILFFDDFFIVICNVLQILSRVGFTTRKAVVLCAFPCTQLACLEEKCMAYTDRTIQLWP